MSSAVISHAAESSSGSSLMPWIAGTCNNSPAYSGRYVITTIAWVRETFVSRSASIAALAASISGHLRRRKRLAGQAT